MPLYVADALEAAERDELRRHLAGGCVACAGSLAEAQATFAMVPLALDPVHPPPELLQRVMDRIDSAAVRPPRPTRLWWLPVVGAVAAAVVVTAAVTKTWVDRRTQAAVDHARLTYNGDVRAALLKSVLAGQQQTIEQLKQKLGEQQQLVDALRSEGSRVVSLSGTGQPGASAQLVWAPAVGRSVLLSRDLAALPSGRTYELWFITTDQRKVPAATFSPDDHGAATLTAAIPADLPPLAAAAVTDEPAGGTSSPTGQIRLVGKVQ